MSAIQVTATGSTITASATSSSVAAAVGSTVVQASAAGGLGPQGPAGTDGGPIEQLSNVQISGVADGDVLRYATGAWRNKPEFQLIDGGHY